MHYFLLISRLFGVNSNEIFCLELENIVSSLILQFHNAQFFPFFKALCKISLDNDTIDDSSEQNIKVQYGEDFEIQGNNNAAGEEDGDVITISESLAKSHFPELLANSEEVYEISNTEGSIDGLVLFTEMDD